MHLFPYRHAVLEPVPDMWASIVVDDHQRPAVLTEPPRGDAVIASAGRRGRTVHRHSLPRKTPISKYVLVATTAPLDRSATSHTFIHLQLFQWIRVGSG